MRPSLPRAVAVLCTAGVLSALLPALAASAAETAATRVEPGGVALHTVDGLATGEVTPGGTAFSEPTEVPAFTMVGFAVPAGAHLAFRTSADGTTWQPWQEAPTMAQEGEYVPVAEGGPDWADRTEPLWVGDATWLQTRVTGAAPEAVTTTLLDTGAEAEAAEAGGSEADERTFAAAAASGPRVVSRAQWGAGSSRSPSYHSGVRAATLHHTAGSNSYTCAQAPAVVRGIWAYHTAAKPGGQGWSDIGYHFLVDKCGTVYEGRAGGIDRPVMGAHAGGFNTGTFGIAILGDFSKTTPTQAALDAVADVVGWKFALHGVNPTGKVTLKSGGSTRYKSGVSVTLPTLFGHRDVSATACPGDALTRLLPALRTSVAARATAWAGATASPVPAPAPAPAPAPTPVTPPAALGRLGSADAVTTALAVSREAFGAGTARHAVLTHTTTFADAMTAGPLAGRDGPLLYTGSTLPAAVRDELQRVLPAGATVYLVGGRAVLPDAVADALEARYRVRRLAGPTRLETSAAVAAEVIALRGRPVALVARAYGGSAPWADAVAGGAYGARHGTPVLLTETDQLSGATRAAIDDLRIERTVVLGGTGAVSDTVLARLPDTQRIAGKDRAGTAVAVAVRLWGRTKPAATDRYVLVGGYGEADWTAALASAPLVARRDAPLLLTAADRLSPATGSYLGGLGYTAGRAGSAWVVGGGVTGATAAQAAAVLGR